MPACGLQDERRAEAQGISTMLADALAADQNVTDLTAVLAAVQAHASKLLAQTVAAPPQQPLPPPAPGPAPTPPTPTPPAPTPPPLPLGEVVVEERQQTSLAPAEATALLDSLRARVAATPGARLTVTWRLTRPQARGERGGDR